MAEFIVGMTALNRRLNAISGPDAGTALMTRLSLRTVAAMKQRVRRKTSTTGRSIHPGPITPNRAAVLGSLNLIWLDQGTKAHTIRPKFRKALRWGATAADRRLSGRPRKGANVRFAKVVHHPGTKPQPFLDASVKEALARSGLADAVVERWNAAA